MRRPGPRTAWPSYGQSRRQTGAAGSANSRAGGPGPSHWLLGANWQGRARGAWDWNRIGATDRPGNNEALAASQPAKPRHGCAWRRQKGRRPTARGRPGPPESRSPPTRRAGSQRRDPSPTRTLDPTQTGASAASIAGNDSPATVGNCLQVPSTPGGRPRLAFPGRTAGARALLPAGLSQSDARPCSRNPLPASKSERRAASSWLNSSRALARRRMLALSHDPRHGVAGGGALSFTPRPLPPTRTASGSPARRFRPFGACSV